MNNILQEILFIFPVQTPAWWGKHILIGAFSVLFLLLGIDTLIAAYHLKNPHEFIMFFFASNLMILVSSVGILYAGIKFRSILRPKCHVGEEDSHADQENNCRGGSH